MNDGIIVFVRFASERLPGKALVDLCGRSLLQRVLDRVRRVETVEVIVATSIEPSDDAVAAHAEAEGVAVFRGPLSNVAARALGAATWRGFERFARVCADRPFTDPTLIADALARARDTDADLVTTHDEPPVVPPGLTTEVIRTEALRVLLQRPLDADDLEHVTRAFYRDPDAFRIERIRPHLDVGSLPLVVDDVHGLELVREVLRRIGQEPEAIPTPVVARTMALVRQEHERSLRGPR